MSECPVSYITPQSLVLLRSIMSLRRVHDSTGYAPDGLERKMYEAADIIEQEHNKMMNALAG